MRLKPVLTVGILLAGFVGMFFYNLHLEGEAQRLAEMEALTRLNQRILQAEEAGDTDTLAPFLADEFAIVRASGEQQMREKFLDDIPANAHRGRKADRTQVRLYGNDAVFTCRATTKRDNDGDPAPASFWNTRVFRRQEGVWRCVAWQVTEMTQD
jgi:ketosteroid isomerase-like protein